MEKLSFIDSIEKMLEQEDLISLGRDAQDLRGKFYDYILEQERVEQVKQLEAKEKGTEYTPVSFENEKELEKSIQYDNATAILNFSNRIIQVSDPLISVPPLKSLLNEPSLKSELWQKIKHLRE